MKIKKSSFVGKTIQSINTRAVNRVIFDFTDSSRAELEVEAVIPHLGLYGIVQVAPDGVAKSVVLKPKKAKAKRPRVKNRYG